MDYIVYVWPGLLSVWLFGCGCAVGSFLNVCIYRLPRGKALTWPSSRCGACLTPIRLKDNVPLLSYWRLRGRCRACGARFSMRYFWVEAATGAAFAALYWAEVCWNLHGLPIWGWNGAWYFSFPPHFWPFYLAHALLAALLFAALGCLVETGGLPRVLVAVGAAAGLTWAVLYPWPAPLPRYGGEQAPARRLDGRWGERTLRGPMPEEGNWATVAHSPRPGFMPWPIWGPLPPSLSQRPTALGLITGLAGVLGGAWLLRGAGAAQRALTGEDGLSLAAGIVVMTGGFLGWQPILVAIALATVITLMAGRRGGPTFATALSVATAIAWLGWPWLGPLLHPMLFDPVGAALFIAATAISATAVTWPGLPPAPPSSDSTAP